MSSDYDGTMVTATTSFAVVEDDGVRASAWMSHTACRGHADGLDLFSFRHVASYSDFSDSQHLFPGISMQQYSWRLISPLRSIPAGFLFAWFNSGYMHSSVDGKHFHAFLQSRHQFVDRVSCLATETGTSDAFRRQGFLSCHRDRCRRRPLLQRPWTMGSELQRGWATPCAEGTLTDLTWLLFETCLSE